MQVLEAVGATYDPYPLRRERAAELGARYAFASQVLGFYSRLTEVQARAFGVRRVVRAFLLGAGAGLRAAAGIRVRPVYGQEPARGKGQEATEGRRAGLPSALPL